MIIIIKYYYDNDYFIFISLLSENIIVELQVTKKSIN